MGSSSCSTLLDVGAELVHSVLQCLHPRAILCAACTNSSLRCCCSQESLWLIIVQRQWHIQDIDLITCGDSATWRLVCKRLCAHPSTWSPLKHWAAVENRTSDSVQRFLMGISNGFMPTDDGFFTYHCASATPIHYRFGADGRWNWSPDRTNWFPTDTTSISTGPFGSAGWKLVDDNEELVAYLHCCPIVPLFRKAVPVQQPAALASFLSANDALLEDFVASLEALPPTTACIACNCFTVHFLLLPALQFSWSVQGWDVRPHCQDAILSGEAEE